MPRAMPSRINDVEPAIEIADPESALRIQRKRRNVVVGKNSIRGLNQLLVCTATFAQLIESLAREGIDAVRRVKI